MGLFIYSQNRRVLLNVERASLFQVVGNCVTCVNDGATIQIGRYANDHRAIGVMEEIIEWLSGCGTDLPFEGIDSVFFMPEV